MRAEYERINLAGTRRIVDAAISEGVKRLVFFSTIAVYGDSGGEILTEASPTRPSSCYAETKLAAERIVSDAQRADGQPLGTVLRLGAVYGSRIKGNYHRLVRSLARGRFIPIGDGSNRRTLINDQDVANVALLVMREPAAAGQIYNVSDGEFHTLNQIIAAMCDALGRKAPARSFPERPARVVANIVGTAARLTKRTAPISAATVAKFTEDIAVDSSRIQSEIGFRPEVDLKTGWSDAVAEMRKNGDL
jgi:UDP-glucose 4-epimerase